MVLVRGRVMRGYWFMSEWFGCYYWELWVILLLLGVMGESWGLSVRNWGNLLYKAITVLWGYEYEVWFLRDGVGILVFGVGLRVRLLLSLKLQHIWTMFAKPFENFSDIQILFRGKLSMRTENRKQTRENNNPGQTFKTLTCAILSHHLQSERTKRLNEGGLISVR